ncbi:MAG: DUF1499 domain-containing protein [Hyphomicrobiaceae bacterium]|nr:DUF1499 domain-containing protein [Hyphomicrobiaceae bacterium]
MTLAIARYPGSRSRAALIAAWCGRLSLPMLVIAGLAHRFVAIDTPTFLVLLAVALILAAAGVVAAIVALVSIWQDGSHGLGDAVRGGLLALLTLTPAMVAAVEMATLPRLDQVSTDLADPPFFRRVELRTPQMNALHPPGPKEAEAQRKAYPDLLTRRYDIDVIELDQAVMKTIDRVGWRIVDRYRPVNERDRGRIEAVARTLVLGFRDDVAIRILPDSGGARIDLRSVSRFGKHDLGANAERIREFHRVLDQVVVEMFPQ